MRQAFSLVELSIVLVILGLLTGGILTGQNLIRAAELRSVTTEYQAYQTAINTFRDKYFALPGDMRNATDFWGAVNPAPATCQTTEGTGTQTCNGNGNGALGASGAEAYERFRAMQQLANAGLIEGAFSGVSSQATAAGNGALIGTNTPTSKLSNAGWYFSNIVLGASTDFSSNIDGNVMFFGGQITNGPNYNPVIAPEEAWNIDTKIDDGKPLTGMQQTFTDGATTVPDCSDGTTDASEYDLAQTGSTCTIIFKY